MPVGQAVTATRLRVAGAGWRRRRGAGAPRPARGRREQGSWPGRWSRPELRLTRATTSSRTLGGAQRVGEGRLHERAGELGEDLQVVGVAAGGSRDQEHQVGRAVLGAEVHPRLEPGEGQGGLLDPGGAAVGDGEAAGETGGGGLLAGEGVGDELLDVVAAARVADDAGQRADDVVLGVAEGGVEPDQVGGDQVGHGQSPWVGARTGIDGDLGGVDVLWLGDGGAGQAGGGAAVGHGEGEAVAQGHGPRWPRAGSRRGWSRPRRRC